MALVKATLLPSRFRISSVVSVTLVTVKVRPVSVWPLSTVLTEVPLNRLATPPPSVNVGLSAVAVSVGSAFTDCTVTVEPTLSVAVSSPPLALPPESTNSVNVTTRFVTVGSTLSFW